MSVATQPKQRGCRDPRIQRGVPTPGTLGKIREGAIRRAQGEEWDTIAQALGYKHGDSAKQQLQQRWPDVWCREEYDAWRARWAVAEGKALTKQVQLLDCPDPKVAEAAAHSILATAARSRPSKVDVTHTHKLSLGDLLDVAARRKATRAALVALQGAAQAKGLALPPPDGEIIEAECTVADPPKPEPAAQHAPTCPTIDQAPSGAPGSADDTTP